MPRLRSTLIASLALLGSATLALAQDAGWPSRAVKLVVSTPPGSGQDLIARALTEPLQKRLGQPFVVENVPGAGSVASATAVVKAPADGYTVLVANIAPIGIVPQLRADMPYDAAKDLVPVGQVNTTYFMILVNPQKVPVGTLPELIRMLKADPGKYTYASSGPGGVVHLQTELFMQRTGTRVTHVPYKSLGEVTTALLGGHVDMGVSTIAEPALSQVKSGALRALAVTSDTPRPELPGVPPAVSMIPDYRYGSVWQGLFVKAGTPRPVIDKLNAAVTEYLKTPEGVATMSKLGYDAAPLSADDFAKLVREEVGTWSQIIKANNIKLE
jgi:tripartite-type tricarboxylate transporter receptor subunit TctC